MNKGKPERSFQSSRQLHPHSAGSPRESWTARFFVLLSLLVSWAIISSNSTTAQGSASDIVALLELRKPVEREIGIGETHSFRLDLKAGTFIHLFAFQRGVNISATLISPDGQRLVESNNPFSMQEAQWITHVSKMPGAYRIEIRCVEAAVPGGKYRLELTERRKSSHVDEVRLSAMRVSAEARALFAQEDADSKKKAAEKFLSASDLYSKARRSFEEATTLNCLAAALREVSDFKSAIERRKQALLIYRRLNDTRGEGDTLYCLAYDQQNLILWDEAIANYLLSLEAVRKVGNRDDEADVLYSIGFAYALQAQRQKAIEYYQLALPVAREVKNRFREALVIEGLGIAFLSTNQFEKSIDWSQQSLAAERELHLNAAQAVTLNRLGFLYYRQNQAEAAKKFYSEALDIERKLSDRDGEATSLSGLGSINSITNQEEALRLYKEALSIRRELPDRAGEARVLNEVAMMYWVAFDFSNSIVWDQQALQIWRDLKDTASEAATLDRLGLSYRQLNRLEASARCFQELADLRHALNDTAGEAMALSDLALIYYLDHKSERAAALYQSVLAKYRELNIGPLVASTLKALGDTQSALKRYEQAVDYYNQALAIRKEPPDRGKEAEILRSLGSAYSHLKQFKMSTDCYEKALAIERQANDFLAEGYTLESMANSYLGAGDRDKAIDYLTRALAIWRENKYQPQEANALASIAGVYERLREQRRAIDYYEQALEIRHRLNDGINESILLTALAKLYMLSDEESANKYLEHALELQRRYQDKDGEIRTLILFGFIQGKLSHYDKEIGYYERALSIADELNTPNALLNALSNLGSAYKRLGQPIKALEYLERALQICRQTNNSPAETNVLISMGNAYSQMRQYPKAIEYLEQSLLGARHSNNQDGESQALIYEAAVYRELNQHENAMKCVEQALLITGQTRNPINQMLALTVYGIEYFKLKQPEKATVYLDQALDISRENRFREAESAVLQTLMQVWAERHQPSLAIILGKKSVNIIQEIRNEISDLDPTLQRGFVETKKSAYRLLADLLASQGRLAEAQQALDMLKQDEFSKFVMRDRNVTSAEERLPLSAQEAELEKRYSAIANRLTALGVRRGDLLARAKRSAEDERELVKIEADIEIGNKAFQSFLAGLENSLGNSKSSNDELGKVREAEGLMETLRELGRGVVAVYTILGEQGFRSILITADVQKGYSVSISAADLNRKILAFRQAVRDPSVDPRPLGRELYEILVKPMEKDLEGAQAHTIMWSLDGSLRYIPVNALYDGDRYLLERFCNVVFTAASQSRLKDAVSRDWRGLGVGVSLAHEGFQALPNVPNELGSIIKSGVAAANGILPGTIRLDAEFTREGFRAELRKHYSIVHIASHFDFAPGTDRNSFLLLGDGGKLTLEEFRSLPQVLQGVELLTLSACDTAVGGEDADGKEVEGFAVLAQRQGAKAVVATLWAVADESTAQLMKEFYRLRISNSKMTKAEALRQAQLELLSGRIGGNASEARGAKAQTDDRKGFVKDPKRPYAHPYFWAPFLLMGNWK